MLPQHIPVDKLEHLEKRLYEITELNTSMTKEYKDIRKTMKKLVYERNNLLDKIAGMDPVSSDDNSSDIVSDNTFESDSEVSTSPLPVSRSTLKRPRQSPQHGSVTVTSAPPKRSKVSHVVKTTRGVQPIECDDSGNPVLPQQIGVLTVLKLGKIESEREAFHNNRYIFPVGYTVQRAYPSMVDPDETTLVTSTIIDGVDGPRFQVVAADMPDQPIIANSATGAWTVVVRRSNEIRKRDHSNSASGPDYYGFKHPTIAKMIQDLPGARNLKHYVWQEFKQMKPRAAKGVMAAAQKKRGNLEQMGNANRRAPPPNADNLTTPATTFHFETHPPAPSLSSHAFDTHSATPL